MREGRAVGPSPARPDAEAKLNSESADRHPVQTCLGQAGGTRLLRERGHAVEEQRVEAPAWRAELRTAFELQRLVAAEAAAARAAGQLPILLAGNCNLLRRVEGAGADEGDAFFRQRCSRPRSTPCTSMSTSTCTTRRSPRERVRGGGRSLGFGGAAVLRRIAGRVPVASATFAAYDPAFDPHDRMARTALDLLLLVAEVSRPRRCR